MKKVFVEFLGTFWLVFAGCGSALIATKHPDLGIGYVGVSLAFGVSLLSMIYAFGNVSGAHFNPAVTLGLFTAGKFDKKEILPYIIAQIAGSVLASFYLYTIYFGQDIFEYGDGAINGYGQNSPGKFDMITCLLAESLLTFFFLLIILGSTSKNSNKAFAGLSIGLALTLIHLISIPITNTSVNPARSTGQAIFAGELALQQLWLFWLAPIGGAILAGFTYKYIFSNE
jgi:aquaporin Z